jgi:hypothetical protein
LFNKVRYSMFYTVGNKTLAKRFRLENLNRVAEAEQYFSSLKSAEMNLRETTFHSSNEEQPGIKVALTVITVSRNRHSIDAYKPKYLTQIMWKYVSYIREHKNSDNNSNYPVNIKLSLCNVDHDPSSYEEARWIGQFVPSFQRFNATLIPFQRLNTTNVSIAHVLEKEKQDYIFCLNESLVYKPDYVFLVEDDAMPTEDMFRVLRHVLHTKVEYRHERGEMVRHKENLAYVKFYHPDRLLSFLALDRERLSELFGYAALLSLSLTGVIRVCFGRNRHTANVRKLWRKMMVFTLLVLLSIGRTSVMEWRRFASPTFYSYTPAPTCCTQAMLFPNATARHTISFLNSFPCSNETGKDDLLDRMLSEHQMTAHLVQPNTFTHIGMYSAVRQSLIDPFIV